MFKRIGEIVKSIDTTTKQQRIISTANFALKRAEELNKTSGLSQIIGADSHTVARQLAAEILLKESRDPGSDMFVDTIKSIPIAGLPFQLADKARDIDAQASRYLKEEIDTTLLPSAQLVLKSAASIYIDAMINKQDPGKALTQRLPSFKKTLGR